MKSAIDLLTEKRKLGYDKLDIVVQSRRRARIIPIEVCWLRDMGYIKFSHKYSYEADYRTSTTHVNCYVITAAGFELLAKHGVS